MLNCLTRLSVSSCFTLARCKWIAALKAYSLMSNRGRSKHFQNLNFVHISVGLLYEAQFPKRIRLKSFHYEMRAVFHRKSVHKTLFNTVVYGSNETHI